MLFTEKDSNDVLNKAARDLLRAFNRISNNIELSEFDLNGPEAKKHNVNSSPTLIFDPDRYSIRYLGVPFGEEGRTLVGMILLLGFRTGNMSDQSRKIMSSIGSKREIKVFVSPTCPYCPDQAINAVKAAIERPDIVSLEIIDIQSNQEPPIAIPHSACRRPLQTISSLPMERRRRSCLRSRFESLNSRLYSFLKQTPRLSKRTLLSWAGGRPALRQASTRSAADSKPSVIERGPLGGQVAATPIVENYPGFTRVPGKTLVDILVSHALEYVQIFQGEEVVSIKPGPTAEVQTNRRKFLAKGDHPRNGRQVQEAWRPRRDALHGSRRELLRNL